jgi:magnesium-transporting ATPase (P-type)
MTRLAQTSGLAADGGHTWQLLGLLPLEESPRPDAKETIAEAEKLGQSVKGVTGDDVNDAPALKQADSGVAVSSAIDPGRSAAALILTARSLDNGQRDHLIALDFRAHHQLRLVSR